MLSADQLHLLFELPILEKALIPLLHSPLQVSQSGVPLVLDIQDRRILQGQFLLQPGNLIDREPRVSGHLQPLLVLGQNRFHLDQPLLQHLGPLTQRLLLVIGLPLSPLKLLPVYLD
jgi:hypothetical protein